MAAAIKDRRPVRGVTAVAERPDGVRVNFVPLPTPIFDEDGDLVGAVNMLIDVTDLRQIADLKAQAQRGRRLARGTAGQAGETLTRMAEEFEAKAAALAAGIASTLVVLA